MPGRIHPTAIVTGEVALGDDAEIGPYCVVDGPVTIGARSKVLSHTAIHGTTVIGADCVIGPHAAVGTDPQHLGYKGEPTCLVVGDGVKIREFASLNRASKAGMEQATRVGPGCFLMAGSHVGHDSVVGSNVIMANSVHLGGHVIVGDRAFIGGGTVVHQFTRVGRLAIVNGDEPIIKDVLPFGAVTWRLHKGYNAVGCRRAGMSAEAAKAVRAAYRVIHATRSRPAAANLLEASPLGAVAEVRELIEFIRTTRRGVLGSSRSAGDDD